MCMNNIANLPRLVGGDKREKIRDREGEITKSLVGIRDEGYVFGLGTFENFLMTHIGTVITRYTE